MVNFKKIIATTIFATSLFLCANASFEKTKAYTEGQFTDVSATEWYAKEVKAAYEIGLMNGIGGGLFDPDGNVTVAEAITMASRAAAVYYGEQIPAVSGEWFQMYVDYAVSKGFVKREQFPNFDRSAKRYEVAIIFENAMPNDYFIPVNDVTAIPDVSKKAEYYNDLLTLYKAGVVMGSDSYGRFKPFDNITRAEAAAIINRVALPENRLVKALDKVSEDDAYELIYSPNLNIQGGRTGLPSGWKLDNRGGLLAADYKINLAVIKDESDTEAVRLIKEFNSVTTGIINIETLVTLNVAEGFYFEISEKDGVTYKITVKDGLWQYLCADGSYATVGKAVTGENLLRITADLDNKKSTTIIGDISYSGELLSTTASAITYGSTDEGKAEFKMNSVYAYVNYAVNEVFRYDSYKKYDNEWHLNNARVQNEELVISGNGMATKYFSGVSGNVVLTAFMYLDGGTAVQMNALSGGKVVANVKTDGKNIYVNDNQVYNNYHDGLWYTVRLELDTANMKLGFKLNGIKYAELPLPYEEISTVDGISFMGLSGNKDAILDNISVFRVIDHEDYVPVPVKPAGEEKYNVGINVCSLWIEGKHNGWETITPFEEPYMGYYTEGIPETADWEIKYMVEHGIDFQAFCWYSFDNNKPVKENNLQCHLDNGYKNARYSHMMSYALLLELANKKISLEAWKKYTVPYIKEHYFKDPRYMKIDNKVVVCTFNISSLLSPYAMGSADNVKKAFELLEQAAVESGYDGTLVLSCASGLTKTEEAYIGVDGSYNYNFGTAGSRYDTNVSANEYQARDTAIHTVPTVSVGFSSVGWSDERYPLISVEDFKRANKWVVEQYLPKYASQEEPWKGNTVMLSTWNEFGEGTYINPSKNNGGFGYLDGIRETYTDEKADEKLNTIPTEAQAKRINRMYPSHKQLLLHEGYVSKVAQKEIICEIDCSTDRSIKLQQIGDGKQSEKGFEGVATDDDPRYVIESFPNTINTADVSAIRVTMKVPKGSVAELFFRTSEEGYSQDNSMAVDVLTDEMTQVTFSVANHPGWKGRLTGIYVDPIKREGNGKSFVLKKVEFLGKNDVGLLRQMTINGLTFGTNFSPVIASNGDILVPFDLTLGLEYKLDTYVEWDKFTKTITINGEGHSISFTVGSKHYKCDGTEKMLEYEIPTVDGLPAIPIKLMAEAFGYEYSYSDQKGISVNIPKYKDMYKQAETEGWDFNILGFMGGWTSNNANLEIHPDGYLIMTNDKDNDPVMMNSLSEPFEAGKFTKLKVRLFYEYSQPLSWTQIFWITNKDGAWSEEKSAKIYINELSSGGIWKEFTIDLTKYPTWLDEIVGLRFDPFNSKGYMYIDYIHFLEE